MPFYVILLSNLNGGFTLTLDFNVCLTKVYILIKTIVITIILVIIIIIIIMIMMMMMMMMMMTKPIRLFHNSFTIGRHTCY